MLQNKYWYFLQASLHFSGILLNNENLSKMLFDTMNKYEYACMTVVKTKYYVFSSFFLTSALIVIWKIIEYLHLIWKSFKLLRIKRKAILNRRWLSVPTFLEHFLTPSCSLRCIYFSDINLNMQMLLLYLCCWHDLPGSWKYASMQPIK